MAFGSATIAVVGVRSLPGSSGDKAKGENGVKLRVRYEGITKEHDPFPALESGNLYSFEEKLNAREIFYIELLDAETGESLGKGELPAKLIIGGGKGIKTIRLDTGVEILAATKFGLSAEEREQLKARNGAVRTASSPAPSAGQGGTAIEQPSSIQVNESEAAPVVVPQVSESEIPPVVNPTVGGLSSSETSLGAPVASAPSSASHPFQTEFSSVSSSPLPPRVIPQGLEDDFEESDEGSTGSPRDSGYKFPGDKSLWAKIAGGIAFGVISFFLTRKRTPAARSVYIVDEEDTIESLQITPDHCEVGSNFYRLNQRLCNEWDVYPGQPIYIPAENP